MPHLKISGKGGKTRYVPLHTAASSLIHEYLEIARHELEDNGALFRTISNNRIAGLQKRLRLMAFIKWYRIIQISWALRSGRIRLEQRRPLMR